MIRQYDPVAMRVRLRFRAPQAAFPFGTDQFEARYFARVVYGTPFALDRIVDRLAVRPDRRPARRAVGAISEIRRAADAFDGRVDGAAGDPAIGLTACWPVHVKRHHRLVGGLHSRTARIVRASALVTRELEFIEAARVAGASNFRIMRRHRFPNAMCPLLVQSTFVFAYAILAEAALSFLGVGPSPPTPTWGNIIAEGRDHAVYAWWIMLFPGVAISFATLGMNLLGDGLRDTLDPRLKVET